MGVRKGSLESMGLNAGFWDQRRVLITGDTGFKGAWLRLWLESLGAQVAGLSLEPVPNGAYICLTPWGNPTTIGDIRDRGPIQGLVKGFKPEIVFHLAAQALVVEGWEDPTSTYETNVMGTVNLLDSLRGQPHLEAIVVVTTDKVYRNHPSAVPHRESDALGGADPYSSSKACVELLTRAWARLPDISNVRLCTARSGNVIGGGDESRDRLVPDAIKALRREHPIVLRHPDAVRPWQHVLDPLFGYLLLAERSALDPLSIPDALNFGPSPLQAKKVSEVIELLISSWGKGSWKAGGADYPEEAELLLDSSLAAETLGWKPAIDFHRGIDWVVDWYRALNEGIGVKEVAVRQIQQYMELAA